MKSYPAFAKLLQHHLTTQDRSTRWSAQQLNLHASTVTHGVNGETKTGDLQIIRQIARIFEIQEEEQQQFLKAAGYEYVNATSNAWIRPICCD